MRKNFIKGGHAGDIVPVYFDGWDIYETCDAIKKGFLRTAAYVSITTNATVDPSTSPAFRALFPSMSEEAIKCIFATHLRHVAVEIIFHRKF